MIGITAAELSELLVATKSENLDELKESLEKIQTVDDLTKILKSIENAKLGEVLASVKTPADVEQFKEILASVKTADPSQQNPEIIAIDLTELKKSPTRVQSFIKGSVIDIAGKGKLVDKQVIIYAKKIGKNQKFIPIISATTDTNGNFMANYMSGKYSEAYAKVSGIEAAVPIPLEKSNLQSRILLDVIAPVDQIKTPSANDPPHLPDHADFASKPGVFSTDVGVGKCVEFTVPNRTLEEFDFYSVVRTTDPQVYTQDLIDLDDANIILSLKKQLSTLNEQLITLTKVASKQLSNKGVLDLLSEIENVKNLLNQITSASSNAPNWRMVARNKISKSNPIEWDNPKRRYQSTSIAHGHILHIKQVWKADGYSLGDLLYSLPLAPCQKKQIAIIDWERKEIASRTEFEEQKDQLSAELARDRDISEIVNSTLRENVVGRSRAFTAGLSGSYDRSSKNEVYGVSGGMGFSSSKASQNSLRSIAANSLQQIRDKTMQSAESVRNRRSTVIETVGQEESVRTTSEVVANHNHCHSMTMQYFEVLRHFQVSQELTDVQECLFIPLLVEYFDNKKVMRWKDTLASGLLKPNLGKGFDAIERIENNYSGSSLPSESYSDEILNDVYGEIQISFDVKRPKDEDWVTDIVERVWCGFKLHNVARLTNIKNVIASARDNYFANNVLPEYVKEYVSKLTFEAIENNGTRTISRELKVDPTLIRFDRQTKIATVSLSSKNQIGISRKSVDAVTISTFYDIPNDGVAVLVSGSLNYRNPYLNKPLFGSRRILNDLILSDPVYISTPMQYDEKRNPRNEDNEITANLLSHLNENLEYYHQIIWLNMDREKRFMLLDGLAAPKIIGNVASTPKSLASVIENRIIGIVGNSIVMPVALGLHLDPTYIQDEDNPTNLLDAYVPTTPIPPSRISVPTRGVFAEAVMGSCNSCEEIDDSRFWKFEEHPCGDEPTPIMPLNTESRRSDPGDLRPKDMQPPMINIQNTPSAPDPTGLSSALGLLGTSGLFKDITGLEGNQQNAISALTSTLDGAKSAINGSVELGKQKMMMDNLDNIIDAINKAEKNKQITSEKARELRGKAFDRVIGSQGNLSDTISASLYGSSKTPIIFVPGIFGSVLSDASGEVFPTTQKEKFLKLKLHGKTDVTLSATGVVMGYSLARDDSADLDSGHLVSVYKDFFEYFIDDGWTIDTDLILFAYDWRKDLRSAAKSLKDKIITATKHSQSAVIVAHSLGTLVTRYLMATDAECRKRVDKLILIAPPNHGSPAAIIGIRKGFDKTLNKLLIDDPTPDEMRGVISSWIGAYALLPSKKYYDLVSKEVHFISDKWIDPTTAIEHNIYGNLEYYKDALEFHREIDNVDQSIQQEMGSKTYLIVSNMPEGDDDMKNTIGSVKETSDGVIQEFYTTGDGRVPYACAIAIPHQEVHVSSELDHGELAADDGIFRVIKHWITNSP